MLDTRPVCLECGAEGVATLVFERSQGPNAVNLEFVAAMRDALRELARQSDLRLLVMRGTGASFCVGGDIIAMDEHRDGLLPFLNSLVREYHAMILDLKRLPAPVLASVHGPIAGGGFSLVMACDLVIAARSSRFVVAYPQLATSCDGGLSFFLRQRLGSARATEALTVAGTFSAERALELGLINRVVDDDALASETDKLVAQCVALSRHTLREIKSLIAAQDVEALALQLDREFNSVLRCARTPEFAGRIETFVKQSARKA